MFGLRLSKAWSLIVCFKTMVYHLPFIAMDIFIYFRVLANILHFYLLTLFAVIKLLLQVAKLLIGLYNEYICDIVHTKTVM